MPGRQGQKDSPNQNLHRPTTNPLSRSAGEGRGEGPGRRGARRTLPTTTAPRKKTAVPQPRPRTPEPPPVGAVRERPKHREGSEAHLRKNKDSTSQNHPAIPHPRSPAKTSIQQQQPSPARRDLCKTQWFPPLAGEMSEGQRGIKGRPASTMLVHVGCAKVPRRERPGEEVRCHHPFRGERGATEGSGVCRGGARRTPPTTTAPRKKTAIPQTPSTNTGTATP